MYHNIDLAVMGFPIGHWASDLLEDKYNLIIEQGGWKRGNKTV